MRLVFLDESGININMTRRYGRAKGRARVEDYVPLSTTKSITMLSSVRLDGAMVRITDKLMNAVLSAFSTVCVSDCVGWFSASGYSC